MRRPYRKPTMEKATIGLQSAAVTSKSSFVADTPSDIRLKTEISRVGNTPGGIPLYQFRYKDGATRYEGVMAQDVLAVDPQAVSVGPDGYYRVDYARLGLEMRVCD